MDQIIFDFYFLLVGFGFFSGGSGVAGTLGFSDLVSWGEDSVRVVITGVGSGERLFTPMIPAVVRRIIAMSSINGRRFVLLRGAIWIK